MGGIPLLFVSLLACVYMSNGLSCVPCHTIKCTKIACHYGEEPGVCNCCPRCLKGPYEECGGIWNLAGSCGDGLRCFIKPGSSYGAPGKCLYNYGSQGVATGE